jgi:uncharacterized protein with PQ loop repeat
MMLTSIDVVGYLAACCTTTAFIPQAIKTIRTKDTHSLSLGMYCVFTLGLLLWLLYGAYKGDLSIIMANAATGLLAMVILFHKLRNDRLKKG